MRVALLRGENLRLYSKFELAPHGRLNLVLGDNAAGKTTLLEALYLAARGKSFRAASLAEACGPAQAAWNVFMEAREVRQEHRVGIGWSRAGTDLRLDQDRQARVSDVARAIPLQFVDPQAHRLLEEGPAYRRSFVDWGVFHVEHRFLDVWRRTQKALRQRNKALRERLGARAITAWDGELAAAGEALNQMRQQHVEAVSTGFARWAERLTGEPASLRWNRGWPDGETYAESLSRNLAQHQRLETTVQGPQRAELRVLMSDQRVKGRVSRGQQKMLIAALVLAQAEEMAERGVAWPILLFDDFGSELAPGFQGQLGRALQDYPGQVFVTAFSTPEALVAADGTMFHVEHGTVRAAGSIH